ncbi:MAG: DUF1592 domain-containing protein [Opitutus sp.]|nr:DUF1592 domain-containing protein [Opitutus sp.]
MKPKKANSRPCASALVLALLGATIATAQDLPTLNEVKAAGALRSNLLKRQVRSDGSETSPPKLDVFRREIEPILRETCFKCHGAEKQKADFRLDTLDPDLQRGRDVSWWLEVSGVLSKGEMPPKDEPDMSGENRSKVVEWLSAEIQVASQVRRSEEGHSSFRRMTRYEYNYALQDLLGLPYEMADDLPPETRTKEGFENSSEMLQMSAMQFEYYRELGRKALLKATVRGERPAVSHYGITMNLDAAEITAMSPPEERAAKQGNMPKVDPRGPHFKNLNTGAVARATYSYQGGKMSYTPKATRPEIPAVSPEVLVIPANRQHVFDLGDTLPDTGTLLVRARVARVSAEEKSFPSLRLEFGFQPSNNSRSSERTTSPDVAIRADSDQPQFYEWTVPLGEMRRNPFRKAKELGGFPNPSEYLVFQSVYQGSANGSAADLQIDYLEISAPIYAQWPPESHRRIFIESPNQGDETTYAREVLAGFLPRAWRQRVTAAEIDQKMVLFNRLRPGCGDFQEAMIEVLATALSSPKFLYLVQADPEIQGVARLSADELATRLSMFLWCSTPDQELLDLAAQGRLVEPAVLFGQTKRMLADARSQRFAKHFVRQWLGTQLLDYLDVEKKLYPQFDSELKEAMQGEPIAFFQEVLKQNHSVMDFLHAEYALINERLARHYGLPEVYGTDFRRVSLTPADRRGGLLAQAGLLAMNSDGKDSHPLKRGIWILERILNDPPPPPPPAVPEIDLADPEIAKMTLKERIANHRNHAACMPCHAKIDPWGIALENFDAVGSWRDRIKDSPVDASSLLFNKQKLDGIDGLKRFLLTDRQDQFAGAMVHKLTTYALGRPLTFKDRAGIDELAVNFRKQQDRLGDLITLIVTSDMFKTN